MFQGTYAAFARELSNAFATVGVTLRAVTSTMAEFLEATDAGSVDVAIGRWTADYPDPDSFAYFVHSTHGFQGRLCGSAETDRIVERARVESSPAVRHALYLELEDHIARNATAAAAVPRAGVSHRAAGAGGADGHDGRAERPAGGPADPVARRRAQAVRRTRRLT